MGKRKLTHKYELTLTFDEPARGSKIDILLYFILAFLIALALFFNFVSMCGILGSSMTNTLHDKQNVLLLNTKNVERGDIIVFENGNIAVIKRVIATEFDLLAFVADNDGENEGDVALYFLESGWAQNCIYPPENPLSFKRVDEDFILSSPMKKEWFSKFNMFKGKYKIFESAELTDTLEIDWEFVIEVPQGEYFAMGDNREISSDSRTIGTIKKSAILGKMVYKIKKDSVIEKILLVLYGASTTTE